MMDAPESLSPITRRLVRSRIWISEHVKISELQATLLWAALIGLAGAWASIGYRLATEWLHFVATGHHGGDVESFSMLPTWQRIVVPAAGGLLAGFTLFLGTRYAAKGNSTDYMEAVVVGSGKLPIRASLVKSISALFSGATGASIGREGPLVQISSLLASMTGQWFSFPLARRRQLVACGAAAGIASAYNAPIAGAFFVAEIVLGSMAMNSFGPLVISSVVATLTTRAYFGDAAMYAAPVFKLNGNKDFAAYLVLGIVCGLLAPVFLAFLKRSEAAFAKVKLPAYFRLALGGVIVGLLAIYRPEVAGNGRELVFSVLNQARAWEVLAVILVCKLFATGATFGSGAVGGVFTPTLFVGAASGYLFGVLCAAVLPSWGLDPVTFGLVGMGAFLAATTGAPVMAIIMIFELTLNYGILMPVMLAGVVSYYICRSITHRSLYGDVMKRKGQTAVAERLATLKVGDLMQPVVDTLSSESGFGLVARAFLQHRQDFLPVVENGRFAGLISLHDIKPYLDQPELESLLIAKDVMQENPICLFSHQTMDEALLIFANAESERLPVLNGNHALLGSLTKSDVLLFLAGIPRKK